LAWGAYEVGSGIYDTYQAYRTVRDPSASTGEKVATVGAALAGAILPGGGYTAGAKGGTYLLKNADDVVMRTGRSKNLARRAGDHGRDPATRDLTFEVDKRTDDYAAQRGREQILHDLHNPPLNRIRPIDPKNPKRDEYLEAGRRLP
jgi:hypothetical protein